MSKIEITLACLTSAAAGMLISTAFWQMADREARRRIEAEREKTRALEMQVRNLKRGRRPTLRLTQKPNQNN